MGISSCFKAFYVYNLPSLVKFEIQIWPAMFWRSGYYVDMVGKNVNRIAEYVKKSITRGNDERLNFNKRI